MTRRRGGQKFALLGAAHLLEEIEGLSIVTDQHNLVIGMCP